MNTKGQRRPQTGREMKAELEAFGYAMVALIGIALICTVLTSIFS